MFERQTGSLSKVVLLWSALFILIASTSLAQTGDQAAASSPSTERSLPEVALGSLGEGWLLLDARQAKELSPNAIGGAVYRQKLVGLILKEPVKRMGLEDYATALINHTPLDALLIESVDEVQFLGYPALRVTYSGDEAGGRFRYLNFIFFIEDFGYQVITGGKVGIATPDLLSTFAQSVKLSTLKQTPDTLEKHTEILRGWRLKDQSLEDAISGIKLSPSEGWRLLDRAHLRHLNPEAIAGMLHPERQIYFLLFDRPCPTAQADECAAWISEERRRDLKLQLHDDTLDFSVLGTPRAFQRLSHQEGTYEYLYHVIVQEGRGLELLAWTTAPSADQPPSSIEDLWGNFSSVFESLSLLTPAQKQSLLAQTYQASSHESKEFITAYDSWRKGRYHHFDTGVVWHGPSGIWRVSRERQRERDSSGDRLLDIHAPRYGLHSQLMIKQGWRGSSTQAHEETWRALLSQLAEPRGVCIHPEMGQRALGSKPSVWVRCTLHRGPQEAPEWKRAWTYQLDTIRVEGAVVHLLSWAPTPLFQGAAKVPRERLEDQLSFSQLAGVTYQEGLGWTDERFRYRVLPLERGGRLRIRHRSGLGDASSLVEYHTPQLTLISFAVSEVRPDQLTPFLNRLVSPQVTSQTAPSSQKVWIKGRSTQKLSWPDVNGLSSAAIIFTDDGVLYGLVAVGLAEKVSAALHGSPLELIE